MQIQHTGASHKEAPLSIYHTKCLVTMKTSAYVRIRKDKPTKEGLAAVFIQIRINSENTQLPLEVSWPVAHFDNTKGIFLERYKGDQLGSDYNLYAAKQLAKANEIFIYFRHSDQVLTVDRFHREYVRFGLRENFIAWAVQDNEDRWEAHKIELQTYKNIKSQLKRVEQWRESIPFGELNRELLESLDAWLRKRQKLSNNAAWAILKTMKSQAARAAEAGIHFDAESVQKFRLPATQRRIIFLSPKELERLWVYYVSGDITEDHHRVLRCFLFSTLTGLRFSDVERITWKEIHDDYLIFKPHKTRNLAKEMEIHLPEDSFLLIENSKGKLFNTTTLQHHNEVLKSIATAVRIRKNLTTHVARHTMATEYLRLGGQVHILQLLLGHTKITTTMVYVHVSQEELASAMLLMRAPVSIPLNPKVADTTR